MHNIFLKRWAQGKKGQMTVEYSVMFVVIVAVILTASASFIKPALNRFFSSTANVINASTQGIENSFLH